MGGGGVDGHKESKHRLMPQEDGDYQSGSSPDINKKSGKGGTLPMLNNQRVSEKKLEFYMKQV
jgi:hypothetical protein